MRTRAINIDPADYPHGIRCTQCTADLVGEATVRRIAAVPGALAPIFVWEIVCKACGLVP